MKPSPTASPRGRKERWVWATSPWSGPPEQRTTARSSLAPTRSAAESWRTRGPPGSTASGPRSGRSFPAGWSSWAHRSPPAGSSGPGSLPLAAAALREVPCAAGRWRSELSPRSSPPRCSRFSIACFPRRMTRYHRWRNRSGRCRSAGGFSSSRSLSSRCSVLACWPVVEPPPGCRTPSSGWAWAPGWQSWSGSASPTMRCHWALDVPLPLRCPPWTPAPSLSRSRINRRRRSGCRDCSTSWAAGASSVRMLPASAACAGLAACSSPSRSSPVWPGHGLASPRSAISSPIATVRCWPVKASSS